MKVSYYQIWAYVTALICVFPSYANIGNINIKNIFLVLFYLISFTTIGISTTSLKKSLKKVPFIWLFFVIWLIQCCVDSGLYSGVIFILQTILFFAMIIMVAKNEERIDALIRALINITLPLCILGIVEEFTAVNVFSMIFGNNEVYSEARMSLNRIYSTFTHPISYGIYLTMIAILAVYMLKKYKERRLVFNIFLIIINLCFTVSRSIIVTGLAAIILTYAVYNIFKLTRKNVYYVMVAIILLFLSPLLFPNVLDFFSEIILSVLSTFNTNVSGSTLGSAAGNRFDLYAWTLYSLHGNYLLGMGTNAEFRYVIASYAWGDSIKESLENQYLWIFYQHGLIGLISYILSLINIFVVFAPSMKNKESKSLVKAIFVITLMYIVMFFSTAASFESMVWYVVLALGIVYSFSDREIATKEIAHCYFK